jgi:UDP-GlcNAc:undecaprenyl-phosphate/decaprenyl-phosphate GlcNAc-1-phosphate transferase
MWFFIIACLLPACLVSAIGTGLMRRLAPRWGLIDQPAARKFHREPTPLGGGVGIWAGVLIPISLAQIAAYGLVHLETPPAWLPLPETIATHLEGILYRSGQLWAILGCGTLLAMMGLLDDRKNLPWWPRLLIQFFVAAFLVIVMNVRATVFAPFPLLGYGISILWYLVLINSFNFLDNMDGLSSGIALIAALLFSVVMLTGTSEPRWLVGGALLVLVGSLSGFLFFHNWPPARIFMGDSGSYFIGLLLASFTMLGTYYEHTNAEASRHVILAPLCILAVPLYDISSVIVIRLKQRRSPFHPDKSHFSHRLVELGLKPSHAVLTIYLATLTTGLGGLLLYRVHDWTGAFLVILLVGCVLAIIAILETAARQANPRD